MGGKGVERGWGEWHDESQFFFLIIGILNLFLSSENFSCQIQGKSYCFLLLTSKVKLCNNFGVKRKTPGAIIFVFCFVAKPGGVQG